MLKAAYIVHDELKNTTADDVKKLDVINIAFAHCRDSAFYFEHEESLCHLSHFRQTNPNIKILISIGGWGSGGFSVMAREESTREKFARSCLAAVKRYGLDGIDIDWEYPCLDWAGIDASPDDRTNFTKLLETVRQVFDQHDKNLMLTIAVGNDSYFIENTEMDKVARVLNYISLMTYDMRGCGDTVTGHHTNLLKPNGTLPRMHRSVEHSVKIYHEAGVPFEKLVIGIAFYSRMWKNVESRENNGLYQKAAPGDYGPSFSEIKEKYLEKNGFKRYYDDIAKAPYLFNGSVFISYDDEVSVKEKCRYVKANNLLGVMYWEHSCDKSRTLLAAIED